jgi:hypothetical protein
VIYQNGDKRWYKEGKFHREGDKPARIDTDGSREWYKDDKLHRPGRQPARIVMNSYGSIDLSYYENGLKVSVTSENIDNLL